MPRQPEDETSTAFVLVVMLITVACPFVFLYCVASGVADILRSLCCC